MNWLLIGAGWLGFYGVLFVYFTIVRSPPPGFNFSGPVLSWRSNRGLGTIRRIASAERFWDLWGGLGLAVSLVGVVLSTILVAGSLFILVTVGRSTSIENPANMLVIPGVNDFLPLAAAPEIVLGLVLGMIVHEGGHAIMCYLADIDVKSTGLLFFAGLPLGAFVEPDEESQAAADRVGRLKMFSAGIMNNVVFTLLALALLFGPIAGAISVAPGAAVGGVLAESPSSDVGLERGDRITAIDGTPVSDASEVESMLAESDARTIPMTVNGDREVDLTREVVITQVATDSPVASEAGTSVTAVNGEEVWTEEQFYSAIRAGDSAELTVGDSSPVTVEAGVEVVVQGETVAQDGGALSETELPTGEPVMITHVNGTPVYTGSGLVSELEAASAMEEQTLTASVDGEQREYTVSVPSGGSYGLEVGAGAAGIEITDFGVEYYPAESYLNVLSGGGEGMSVLMSVLMVMFLPLMSLQPGVVSDFPGFIPEIQSFYTVTGMPGEVAGAWFFTASVLYWGAWINLNLAVFNCLPTYALDGGHILRDTVDEVLARIPGGEPEGNLSETITGGVQMGILVILFWLLLSMFL